MPSSKSLTSIPMFEVPEAEMVGCDSASDVENSVRHCNPGASVLTAWVCCGILFIQKDLVVDGR